MLRGKKIVLGVTGGIAVYKAADLVSRLKKEGALVEVVMTEAAMEFVNPLTFQTMSGNPVHVSMFNEVNKDRVEHIDLAQTCDLLLIAPATANTIGKVAHGIADDLLSTIIMATTAQVVFAPAMNTVMYENPLVQANIDKLEGLGYQFIEPGHGLLACGDIGPGKMAEPVDIIEYIKDIDKEKDLEGKKFIVTAGPTLEALDPVRFLTNHSTGKMGYALAKEAKDRGADVVLISGPTNLKAPDGVDLVRVESCIDMFEAVGKYFDQSHVLIKAAAPADYRPESYQAEKIKKGPGQDDSLEIKMIRNPDIAEYFGKKKREGQLSIGFAAETHDLEKYAEEKLEKKNFDFIVANDISLEGAGFKVDTNIVTIIDKKSEARSYPLMEKTELSKLIVDKIKELF